MELNNSSDVRQKMQHSPEENARRRFRPFAQRSPPDPNQIKKPYTDFLVTVKLDDLPDVLPPDKRLAKLGFDDRVYDAKRLPYCSFGVGAIAIPDFKKDPELFRSLTKCATLAIEDYNSQTHTDYQLVDIEMVNWQLVNGILYHMTFQARNADKEYGTFEATVLIKKEFRKVKRIKMKGSSTWYDGTFMKLEDDAPIIMDPKDHYRGVYDLMREAQQVRVRGVESVMANQDEGSESAGALPDLPDILPPDERIAKLGFDDQVFDAKRVPYPRNGVASIFIPDFKKDPESILSLTKSATLAIRDYNSQTHTDYQFLDIEMVTSEIASGFLYHITFQARNADKEYGTFEATVHKKKEFRKVRRIKMKGSSTWYDGTLMQLEDDDPIIMDPEDHYRGISVLMEEAQQVRMRDVGPVMAKQDEGSESAGALPE